MDKIIRIGFYDYPALQLLVDPVFPSGGAAKQVLAWRKGFNNLGHRAVLMGQHKNPDLFRNDPSIMITFNPGIGLKILRHVYLRIPSLIRVICKSGCDYIYYGIPGHFTGLLALITKVCGKKFILRISNDYLVDHRYKEQTDFLRYFFYKICFKLADFILCQNDYQVRQVSKKYPRKTYLIKNPFSGKIKDGFNTLDQRSYIAWVGIIQYQKNIPLLYEIASSLPDVRFKIAGSLSSKLDQQGSVVLEKLKNLPNVEMLGFISAGEVAALLEKAVFLLNTSHYEGFSNTFLESFSVGTPVLTLPQNDPGNIIAKHELGYIFHNVKELESTYERILLAPDSYEHIASNCIDYMNKEHNLETQCQQFIDILLDNKK